MIAAEGMVAIGRMIVAYRRGDGAATNYEIGWVTVALQHLRVGDNAWARINPVHRWLWTLWFGGRQLGYVPAPVSLLALATVVSLRSWRDVILAIYPRTDADVAGSRRPAAAD